MRFDALAACLLTTFLSGCAASGAGPDGLSSPSFQSPPPRLGSLVESLGDPNLETWDVERPQAEVLVTASVEPPASGPGPAACVQGDTEASASVATDGHSAEASLTVMNAALDDDGAHLVECMKDASRAMALAAFCSQSGTLDGVGLPPTHFVEPTPVREIREQGAGTWSCAQATQATEAQPVVTL
jgi:hypothetical protein